MKCTCSNHDGTAGGPKCEGPVILTAHDRRGCRDVCFVHAQWIMTNSIIFGHDLVCPKAQLKKIYQ